MDSKLCSDRICFHKGSPQPISRFEKNGRTLNSCFDCRAKRSARRAALKSKTVTSDNTDYEPPPKRPAVATDSVAAKVNKAKEKPESLRSTDDGHRHLPGAFVEDYEQARESVDWISDQPVVGRAPSSLRAEHSRRARIASERSIDALHKLALTATRIPAREAGPGQTQIPGSKNLAATDLKPVESGSFLLRQAFENVLNIAKSAFEPSRQHDTPQIQASKQTKGARKLSKHLSSSRISNKGAITKNATKNSQQRKPGRTNDTGRRQIRSVPRDKAPLSDQDIDDIQNGAIQPLLTEAGWEFVGRNKTVTIAFAAGLAAYHVVVNGVSTDSVSFTGAQLATFLKAISSAQKPESTSDASSSYLGGVSKAIGYGATAYKTSRFWMPVLEAGLTGYKWYAGTG